MTTDNEQLSMWRNEPVAGVQTRIAGAKFAMDQQITRELEWDEELYVIARVTVKPDTGYKRAVTEGGRNITISEQALVVEEFYELDANTGRVLLDEGHAAAVEIVAARVAVLPADEPSNEAVA